MQYYILGLLLLLISRMFMNIVYAEKRMRSTFAHEVLVLLFGMYMIVIYDFLSDNLFDGLGGMVLAAIMFVPIGIMLPMLYTKFRKFTNIILASLLLSAAYVVFWRILYNQGSFLYVIPSTVGGFFGFVFTKLNISVFEVAKRGFLYRKRKNTKPSVLVNFECGFTAFLVIAMFTVSNATYRYMALADPISVSDNKENKKSDNKENNTGKKEETPASDYSEIYYAHEERYDRYDAYALEHPDYSLEEVVLSVEMGIDRPYYEDMYEYPETELDPLLVNKYHKVPDSFVPQNLVNVYGQFDATAETRDAFLRMQEDARLEGYELHIVSAYRSVAYQYGLYNTFKNRDGQEAADTYSARGGCSEHCTGRALDISNNSSDLDVFDGTPEWEWCVKNAYKYGFILRYPKGYEDVTGFMYESWQFTYVGETVANTMRDNNIATLEEYVVKYVENSK